MIFNYWQQEVSTVTLCLSPFVLSESGREPRNLQLVDAPLIRKQGSADPTPWTSFFTQPQLPVDKT